MDAKGHHECVPFVRRGQRHRSKPDETAETRLVRLITQRWPAPGRWVACSGIGMDSPGRRTVTSLKAPGIGDLQGDYVPEFWETQYDYVRLM